MKTILRLIATSTLLVQFQLAAQGTLLYQNNFSSSSNPGWSRTTVGDTNFAKAWSVASSLQSESDNQYARFSINIPSLPTNPNARWYGGFFTTVGSMLTLPTQWQLSFDIFLSVVEPFQVNFQFNPGSQLPNPPAQSTNMTFTITPADIGWQHVVIDENTQFSLGQSISSYLPETSLRVSLLSHDSNGNPLTISQLGTHYFFLDNVTLQSVPEPSVLALLTMTGALFFGMRRSGTIRCSGRVDCASVAIIASRGPRR